MVDLIETNQRGAYADFDNRALSRGPQRTAVSNLPIIDLLPFMNDGAREDRMHTALAVRSACINIGFFYVTGHGFTVKELNDVLTQGVSFFALPLQEKMKVLSTDVDMPGFVRTGGMDPEKNRDNVVDIKERLSMTRELKPGEQVCPESRTGKTQWPPRELLPAFETTMKHYIARLQRVTEALNHAFALSLKLPEDYFDTLYQHPDMTLTMNFYPPVDPSKLKSTQWSFSPHADYTAFTVLLQDLSGGLQARNSAGEWIDVTPKECTFVVNVGNVWRGGPTTCIVRPFIGRCTPATVRVYRRRSSFIRMPRPSCAASTHVKDRRIHQSMKTLRRRNMCARCGRMRIAQAVPPLLPILRNG